MSVNYRITVRGGQGDTLLQRAVKEELMQVNNELSAYESLSELNQFNKTYDANWIDISENLGKVFKEAYQIYTLTKGNFDPSVGKFVDLWGMGNNKTLRTPTAEEIEEAKKVVGFNKIIFSKNYRQAKKSTPDISLNLSAMAKGYAVDRIAALLEKSGYTDFVIEIGGAVYARGKRAPKAKGWNIGIAKPDNDKIPTNAYVISLKDMAVATSGDYRNYFYIDGKRYSHTIDPKTGYPVEHNLISITVFAKTAIYADALTTGMMTMGESKALEFANVNKIAAVLFVRTEDGYQTLVSQEAQKYIKQDLLTRDQPAKEEKK